MINPLEQQSNMLQHPVKAPEKKRQTFSSNRAENS
jgi:hypothetical protein